MYNSHIVKDKNKTKYHETLLTFQIFDLTIIKIDKGNEGKGREGKGREGKSEL